jgi:hypothetical protein
MIDEDRRRQIIKWQKQLHDTFDHKGVLGGKFLSPTMELEDLAGAHFIKRFHGHRLLTDAFLDLYAETMQKQLQFHNQCGWPTNEPHYAISFLMYVTMFRAVRATELLSVKGYPLQGYALQRSIKDQVLILCAAANNIMSFGQMFGWEGSTTDAPFTPEDAKTMAQKRMKSERYIRSMIIGKKSGLSPEAQAELLHWEQLFNFETHRGLFTLFQALDHAIQGKMDTAIGPSMDDADAAMFMNRSNELNWMILRLIPYMRWKDAPWSDEWKRKWRLLDESFRMMNDGFAGLGKKIPLAHLELMESKFRFGDDIFYFEPKSVAASGLA